MICKKCGKELPDDFNICPYCGEKIIKEETVVEAITDAPVEEETIADENQVIEKPEAPVEPAETATPTPTETTVPVPTEPKEFCKICGGEISSQGNYCTTCGRSTTDSNIMHCVNCGAVLEAKQKFCNKCGTKVKTNVTTAKISKSVKGKKNIIIAIIAAILAVAIIAGIGKAVLPKVFASPYTIMETGDYEKAYKKANSDEKKDVLYENLIAYCCAEIKDNLKNSNSFELNNVWIDEKNNDIVMEVGGTNSYGGMVTSYYLYEYDEDDNEYQYYNSVSDFDEEEYSYYDDDDERLEKLFDNLTKTKVKRIIKDKSLKYDNGIIDRINALSKDNLLKNVELMVQVTDIYPDNASKDGEA